MIRNPHPKPSFPRRSAQQEKPRGLGEAPGCWGPVGARVVPARLQLAAGTDYRSRRCFPEREERAAVFMARSLATLDFAWSKNSPELGVSRKAAGRQRLAGSPARRQKSAGSAARRRAAGPGALARRRRAPRAPAHNFPCPRAAGGRVAGTRALFIGAHAGWAWLAAQPADPPGRERRPGTLAEQLPPGLEQTSGTRGARLCWPPRSEAPQPRGRAAPRLRGAGAQRPVPAQLPRRLAPCSVRAGRGGRGGPGLRRPEERGATSPARGAKGGSGLARRAAGDPGARATGLTAPSAARASASPRARRPPESLGVSRSRWEQAPKASCSGKGSLTRLWVRLPPTPPVHPRQGQERKGVNDNQSSGALALQQPTPPENTALPAPCCPRPVPAQCHLGL